MQKLFATLFLFLYSLLFSENHFVFVVPSYNNIDFYEKNLESLFAQNYPHFRIIYIDDASTDGTYQAVSNWINDHQLQDKTTLIQNQTNQGGLNNIYHAVNSCLPHEIICLVDGDDWLASKDVLSELSLHYNNQDTWMTYGQFIHFPSEKIGLCKPFNPDDLKDQKARSLPWVTSHLKTFYAGLFQKIKKEDLQYNGEFIPSATDLAIMLPMIDMAGTNIKFIDKILYCYNNRNPISHHIIRHDKQRFFAKLIRERQPYAKLERHPALRP